MFQFNVPSYDPKKATENKNILRHMDVESAAKRRDFRHNERKRVGQILAEKKEQPPSPDVTVRNTQPTTSRNVSN